MSYTAEKEEQIIADALFKFLPIFLFSNCELNIFLVICEFIQNMQFLTPIQWTINFLNAVT